MEFSAIAPARAVDEIASQVRDMIAAGALKPGDRLPSERDLSARLRVSRNTLREALRALEHGGIIEMRKGATGGAFVRPGSSGAIVNGMRDLYHLGAITPAELTEARVWLSEVVVRVASDRATEEDFAALEANVDAASKAANFDERAKHNREFHIILARATRNPILVITMEGIVEVFAQFIAQIGPSDNTFILPSRRRFIKHLRARDAAAAAAEMSKALVRLQTKYMAQWSARSAAGQAAD
ncbi:FadR/GntR family transcriptional regulator [Candidimonas nitroreducens]|uniref:GntR family transcriptional regulator n=1 Tax=Candidimonas nitroreducens TaxID=683354 RepID=A0A225MSY9_9BURK|nr:GntR family transcriptional regulator [Candidimonas nitroreducens]OWT63573.1 GntR family transcriptional regulator [Candidimonas nitroreducens]